jgi:hypothetical protein
MPNWCYNSATFVCPSKEVFDKLIQSIIDDNWFETFAPLEMGNNINASNKWGTKWSPIDIDIGNKDETKLTIDISFDTAWSPPLNFYCIMNKDYSIHTTAFYYELGCEFFGRCIYSKSIEMDESFDIPSNKEDLTELQKQIDNELNEFMMPTWECLEEQWENENLDE